MVGALSVVAATSASAQSGALQATIGFDFAAGPTVLPAGTYSVSRLTGPANVLLVRGSRTGVMLIGQAARTQSSREDTRLVFHRYGNRYFLRQIWFAGDSGYAVPETPEEHAWAERAERAASRPTSVTVALTQ
jgi:hypothetical protein